MIHIGHIKYAPLGYVYIGRRMPGITASVLGNPYKPSAGRSVEECLRLYRGWLWSQMQKRGEVLAELERIAALADAGEVWLACWCRKPGTDAPCHGDVVKAAVEWLSGQKQKAA